MFGRRFFGMLLSSALLVACSGGGSPTAPAPIVPTGGGPPALPLIPEVVSAGGVAALTLQAAFDANGRPAFFWNGQEAAPTIRVQPGDTIQLHFVNMLPEFCAVGVQSNSNLHFHGFTSSPNPPGDDVVTTLAAPGTSYDYTVVINPDQPPGLYWYHAHPHGLSSYEVGNGMAGAIVVEGIANEVPATAGLRERVIVLSDIPNDPSFAAGEDAVIRKAGILAARVGRNDSDEGGDPCRPETDATPKINGIPMATIGIMPGETELLRVVNTSGHRHFDIAVDGQQLTLVAQDGVPIHDYPGAPESLAVTDTVIPPGGRSEFLVTGKATPSALIRSATSPGRPAMRIRRSPRDARQRSRKFGQWNGFGARPREDPGAAEAALLSRPAAATGGFPYDPLQEDSAGFYFERRPVQRDGGAGDHVVRGNRRGVDARERHGRSPRLPHPPSALRGRERQRRPAAESPLARFVRYCAAGSRRVRQAIPSLTKVLIDFRDPVIRGTFVYHCHILDHEDGGMMAKIQVL